MLSENPLKFSGYLNIVKHDANGNVVEDITVPNLVVTAGKNLIGKLVVGTSTSSISHMAVGSSSSSPAAGDTGLLSELGRVTLTTKVATQNVLSFVGIFLPGTATGTIQEAGLFNAASAGEMLCRSTFTSITKAATDTVTITWTVTIS